MKKRNEKKTAFLVGNKFFFEGALYAEQKQAWDDAKKKNQTKQHTIETVRYSLKVCFENIFEGLK